MQLAELLKDWPCTVKGSIRVDVSRVEDSVAEVKNGDIFVARKGKRYDGKAYIEEAIERGAIAVVIDDEMIFDALKLHVPIIWVPNCLQFIAFASAKIYGFPSEALKIIAITGTNGKTTVSHFISQLLQHVNKRTLVIGTNGLFLNGEPFYSDIELLTTLQPKHLHKLFYEALRHDVEYVVMEASSMGLATNRLDYCDIDIGVYLNLSEDHLQDHGSFEQYKLAKQRLAQLSKKLVLNGDDTFCRSVGLLSKLEKRYFGVGNRVDIQIQLLAEGQNASTCCIQTQHGEHVVTLPVVGDYQRSNVAAAIATMDMLKFPLSSIAEALQTITLPIGRMQSISIPNHGTVIIDYAHTADALKVVLQTLKKLQPKKLSVVFSCGGERDVAKRREMGTVASKYADYIILTTDNCRSEDPQKINEQIKEGFFSTQKYDIVLDRAAAITKAVEQSMDGEVVVIAGKGHERTQTIGDRVLPFSDIECVERLLLQLTNKK
ncbi:UDP-N-acetylmuramoyl-L-alanyl-D-glutamate--2,6-diaminopimelate ligase [Lysinibacillus sp. 54212]|uniref:UDP-N-acetylmuramoyl-L-alanyl-D-glutamate--2, 6-diaminopimelate ligase n=1 Tax=Lysinibacillus sp. 54212 TaxID=3119829 RepID=UPI002FCACD8D